MSDTPPPIDILPDHWIIVRDILRKHVPQYTVWAFGSRARGTAKPFSDLDLAILTDQPLPLEVSAALAEDFSESDLPYKVDLVDWATTAESFRQIIERDKVVVQEGRDTVRGDMLPLEFFLDALIDYRGKTPRKVDTGIPLITAKVVKSGRIESPSEFIAEEDYETWMTRGYPEIGDVVLTTEAPLGQVAQIKFLPAALAQRIVTLRGIQGVLDNNYLLYLLQSDEIQTKLLERSTGTTVFGIKQSELRKIEVALPPINEQCAIAHILGTLDEKIELNRQMNKTLESIAQALFKSWFVDFDPVRAKIAAKQEGRDLLRAAMSAISGRTDADLDSLPPEQYDQLASTAGLFPDEMEESGLGEIPRGWSASPFGSLLVHNIGGDWGSDSPDSRNDIRVAIIRGTDIPDLDQAQVHRVPIRYTTQKKLALRMLQVGDIVLEVSGGSKDQPTGRSIRITVNTMRGFDCPIEPASFCRLLRPINPEISIILSLHLAYIYAQGKTWEYQNQSTGIANFQTAHFLDAELVANPPAMVAKMFYGLVNPLLECRHDAQSRRLAALRDLLLPKLISGELSIIEAIGGQYDRG